MAKIGKGQVRTLSGHNPELRLNLKEIFGVNFSGKDSLRQALGQALLDRMIERTQSGKDVEGKAFKKYSKFYKNSDAFKAAGKSGNVDLTLTGDMLGLLDIKDESANTITYGWDDTTEAAKAHGHITGDPNGPKVKRDFFGLNDADIKKVRSEFRDDIDGIKKSRGEARDAAVLNLIKRIKEDFEDGES